MPQTKRTARRKRRSKVVLAPGAAGLSLSLASSASAAVGGMNGAGSAPVSKQVYEEEISDVSLATFHLFDREGRRARLAMAAVVAVPVGAICTITPHFREPGNDRIRSEERSSAHNHAQSDGRRGRGTAAALAMPMGMAPIHPKTPPIKMSG
jgi:hypothetical protein